MSREIIEKYYKDYVMTYKDMRKTGIFCLFPDIIRLMIDNGDSILNKLSLNVYDKRLIRRAKNMYDAGIDMEFIKVLPRNVIIIIGRIKNKTTMLNITRQIIDMRDGTTEKYLINHIKTKLKGE